MNVFDNNSDLTPYLVYFEGRYNKNKPTWAQYFQNFYNLVLQNKMASFEFVFEFILYSVLDMFELIFKGIRAVIESLAWAIITNLVVAALIGTYEVQLLLPIWILIVFFRFAIFVVRLVISDYDIDSSESHLNDLINPWVTFWKSNDGQIEPVNFVFDDTVVRDGLVSLSDLIFDESKNYMAKDKSQFDYLNWLRQDILYHFKKDSHENSSVQVPHSARKHY